MLPSSFRLRNKKDFIRVYQRGKGNANQFFLMKSIPNILNENRFGVVVSKKVAAKIVKRNKLKRKIRAALTKLIKEIKIKKSYDIVIVARPSSIDLSFQEIVDQLRYLLKKQKLLFKDEKDSFKND